MRVFRAALRPFPAQLFIEPLGQLAEKRGRGPQQSILLAQLLKLRLCGAQRATTPGLAMDCAPGMVLRLPGGRSRHVLN